MSPLDRRTLLQGIAATLLPAAPLARAQTTGGSGRLVKILVGFPPGQATDTIARLIAEQLRPVTGDNYIVENRPGQGGSLALGELAKAKADGSVMMLAHMSALATNPHLYASVPYESHKDFSPSGLVADLPFVLVCHPAQPFQSLRELVQYAKDHPGKLTNASSGNGTVSHLAMEEFKRRSGINVVHVPYRGSSPGLTDVMGGSVALALETAAAVQPLVQAGKLRALAAATEKRLGAPLAVPTFVEQGFDDFHAATWLMTLYPAATPAATVRATFDAMRSALRTPDIEQRLVAVGALPRYSRDPDEALAFLRSEVDRWGVIVKRSGVTLN